MKTFKRQDGTVYAIDTGIPENENDVELTSEELEKRSLEQKAIQDEFNSIEEYIKLIKKVILENFEDVSAEEMVQFSSAFSEFQNLGKVKLERYPLALAQVVQWVQENKLPPRQ